MYKNLHIFYAFKIPYSYKNYFNILILSFISVLKGNNFLKVRSLCYSSMKNKIAVKLDLVIFLKGNLVLGNRDISQVSKI